MGAAAAATATVPPLSNRPLLLAHSRAVAPCLLMGKGVEREGYREDKEAEVGGPRFTAGLGQGALSFGSPRE